MAQRTIRPSVKSVRIVDLNTLNIVGYPTVSDQVMKLFITMPSLNVMEIVPVESGFTRYHTSKIRLMFQPKEGKVIATEELELDMNTGYIRRTPRMDLFPDKLNVSVSFGNLRFSVWREGDGEYRIYVMGVRQFFAIEFGRPGSAGAGIFRKLEKIEIEEIRRREPVSAVMA